MGPGDGEGLLPGVKSPWGRGRAALVGRPRPLLERSTARPRNLDFGLPKALPSFHRAST